MNETYNTSQRLCPSCGATSNVGVSFCRQCGASLKHLYDDEATSVLTRPVEVSLLNQLNEKPDPEKLWQEGFKLSQKALILDAEGRYNEAKELMEQVMNLYMQALAHGLQGKSEVTCRWLLGNALYDKAMELGENFRLGKEPIGHIPTLSKGVAELEKAVALDSKLGNFIFGNREQQADLLKLDVAWGFQANYVKDKFGAEAGISYIVEKIKLVQHLLVMLPFLFYTFGLCYSAVQDIESAIDLFRVATKAEDYGDVLDHEDWSYQMAQVAKRNAATNLKYLEMYGEVP